MPRWTAIVIALGALGLVAGVNHWVRAADAAVLLAGMGAIGFRMLRQPAAAVATSLATEVSGARPAHT